MQVRKCVRVLGCATTGPAIDRSIQPRDSKTTTLGNTGAINLFEAGGGGGLKVTLHGHRAAVTALCYARSGEKRR